MDYQWYPGHMTKARRMMQENMALIDLLIELTDARAPQSGRNPDIDSLAKGKSRIIVLNKSDLGFAVGENEVREMLPKAAVMRCAVKESVGIDAVEDEIETFVYGSEGSRSTRVLVNNVRHIHLLEQAEKDMENAAELIRRREPMEVIEVDVRSAYDALGEIIGETVSDEILDEVFSRFCLGK